ncbi:hypothetical protein U9R90_24945 [Streptomyces sp. E11-3]|uniref:hypothetical protein n=1 Tax=Streptomyces sp. E11-3 TaxID=3110112 RepID=UPI003980C5BE
MQRGTKSPAPSFRARWPKWSGSTEVEVIEPPRVDEGCLILKPAPDRLLWVPLHTVTGPIEIEAL